MQGISFTKMHGIGNDYVYIDCTRSCPDNLEQLAVKMSNRHTGIGGDGIILILPSEIADFKMRIFNADGSEAKMCGNGTRCVAKYVYDHRLTRKTELTLDTLSGIKTLSLHVDPLTDLVESVTVGMGKADFTCESIPVIFTEKQMIEQPVATSHGDVAITAVSMGNPHGVIFLETLDGLDIESRGPELENHPMWPDRANIEFAHVIDRHTIAMRVWERGSGETMACGTGACAVASAAIVTGRAESPVTVKLLGGDLKITFDCNTREVTMTGPATEVFFGFWPEQ